MFVLAMSRRAAAGRAQLRALKDGRAWPNADSGKSGTDSGCVPDTPGCVWMRRDFEFRQISANSGEIPAKIRRKLANWQKTARKAAILWQNI